MKRLGLCLSLALLLTALCAVGCSGTDDPAPPRGTDAGSGAAAAPKKFELPERRAGRENSIYYNIGAEPKTLDPGKSTGIPESTVIRHLFDTLTQQAPDGTVRPATAESWEMSEDGLTYTFHLGADNKWSNGDPVTAHDFEYAWLRVLKPEFVAEYAYIMYMIAGAEDYNTGKTDDPSKVAVKALDDRTLQVTLVSPTPYFLAVLDHSTFSPVHRATVMANENWALAPGSFISNGPYQLAEIRPKVHVHAIKNPHWRDKDAVKIDMIYFREIEDSGTTLTEFQGGGLDGILSGLPPSDIPTLRKNGLLKTMPEVSVYYVCFNTTKPPFDNKLVRKAFTLAVNRNELTRLIDAGDAPATGFVPVGCRMPDGRDFRELNGELLSGLEAEEAKKALAEAGFPSGRGLPPITYIYNTDARHKTVAEYLNNAWKSVLGVNVAIQNQEWKVLLENRKMGVGNYQVCRHGWVADYADPMTFLDLFISTSGNNDAQWKNPEFDRLIAKARVEVDEAARMELLAKAEKLMIDEYVVCPLFFYVQNFTLRDELKGVERTVLQQVRFDRAYWEWNQ